MSVVHSIKPGVRLTGLTPQMAVAWTIACSIYESAEAGCVMTSAAEGKHKPGSLHPAGMAMDLRTSHLSRDNGYNGLAVSIVLGQALGPEFDVILESDHIHVEWQPKLPLVTP